ncbi:Predicted protein [Wolbachia endosymbiont strain TRS of Brugia malayi]|uniref:hypothetical protein n=1 Tax=Wolbachia endosymbiont of Brugia malayi TaxID=80849 RepID=UPI00004C921A|nr:hypothetical protein [Wolbachia endosymbiont of Brugia malayi]AAW70601.1 Predicted protein [Wolbachia endosymbiont strain TRS of Brugia malayi]
MSNFCKIIYGNNDNQLSEKSYKSSVCNDDLFNGNEEDFVILENEKMYKTKAEFESEGYKII